MKKACNRCKHIYDIKHYINKQNGKETKNCTKCRSQYRKTQFNPNTKYYKLRAFYKKLLEDLPPCVKCGDNNPEHKQFNHIEPSSKVCEVGKCKDISSMQDEAEKCESLCMKCHCKLSYEQSQKRYNKNSLCKNKYNQRKRERKKRKHDYVNKYKIESGGCQNPKCDDVFDPTNLHFYEFDHIDFNKKYKNISDLVRNDYSLERIDQEILKCRLLCGYCHRQITIKQAKEKSKYHFDLSLPKKQRGKKAVIKFSDKYIQKIRKKWNTGKYSQEELATKYHTTSKYISAIVNNKVRRNPKYIKKHQQFKYPDEYIEFIRYLWEGTNTYQTIKEMAQDIDMNYDYLRKVLRYYKRA